MKKLFALFFIFSFCLGSVCQAQPLALYSTKFFGGTLDETIRDAIQTNDGGIVFTGGSASIDGDVPVTLPDTNNSLRYNIMVGKIDSNKQLSWLKIYRGQRKDFGYRVIQTNDGGYAVLGHTESSDGDVAVNRGQDDIWLLRLDSVRLKHLEARSAIRQYRWHRHLIIALSFWVGRPGLTMMCLSIIIRLVFSMIFWCLKQTVPGTLSGLKR
ncbi:MAG TPA: hypothetical protein VEB40_07055 [Flavipsychrobacter sp.]|nr:hypothetical protein [Flavipsychrobacter sp.]